jgi:hypothetical protein
MAWAVVGGAAIAAGGAYLSSKNNAKAAAAGSNSDGTQNGTQNTTSSATLSPAIAKLLGMDGGGILGGLGNSMNGGSNLPGAANDFIKGTAPQILNNGYWNTQQLNSNQFTSPTIQAAQIAAPNQNGIDLSGSFKSLLGGGDTSALMKSLQAGNDLTNAQFQQNTGNVTDNLMKTVLPSIRSNSVLAGQYGGSRQGVAEGNAISDYTKQLTNGATQVGLANSASTAGQLANDYEQGQNRALSAAQGLSAQQYSTAATDAAARQAGDNTNVNALLATRGLNSSNLATGTGLQQNLLTNANALGNSDLTRLGQTAGILAPFLGAGATTSNNTTTNNTTTGNVTQPLYQNTAGNVLGGALAGSQLAGMFGNNSGSPDYSSIRNSDGSSFGSLGGLFGGTPSSLNNMQGSTSSSIYGPSAGGGMNWSQFSNLYS